MINQDTTKHLARLAQLELSDGEVAEFSEQLSSILKYIDRIKNVELKHDIKRDFKKINIFRDDSDSHESGENRADILREMPKVEKNMLSVKKVL